MPHWRWTGRGLTFGGWTGETMGFRLPSTSTDHPVACFSWWDFGWRPDQNLFGVNEQTARTLAWPILRYAYEHRSYQRARIPPLRGTLPPIVRIAVDLLPPLGMKQPKPGYRVVLSVGEIVSCLNRGESCKRP